MDLRGWRLPDVRHRVYFLMDLETAATDIAHTSMRFPGEPECALALPKFAHDYYD